MYFGEWIKCWINLRANYVLTVIDAEIGNSRLEKKIRKEAAPLKIQKQRLETKESMNMHENTKRKKTGMAVDVQRNFPAWLLGWRDISY